VEKEGSVILQVCFPFEIMLFTNICKLFIKLLE